MKKLLIILIITLIFKVNGYSQRLSRNFQMDFLIGATSQSGLSMGLTMKRLFNSFGMYFHTDGLGTHYSGETNIDYGPVADRIETTNHGIIDENIYGMSFGITYDMSKTLKKDNCGLTLFLGTGYAVIEEVSEKYEYYMWDYAPELNEGNLITWISDKRTVPIIEFLVGYDFIKKEGFKLNLNCGYATTHGFMGFLGLGFSL